VAFAEDCPGLFRVMWHPSLKPFTGHPGLAEAAGATLAPLEQLVVRAQAAGVFAPGPPGPLTLTVWSTIHGLTVLALDAQLAGPFGILDPLEAVEPVTRRLLEGLRAEPAGPRAARPGG
jgi:hypothetical protein